MIVYGFGGLSSYLEYFNHLTIHLKKRKSRKANLKEAVAREDDDFVNIPAYERSNT